MIWIMLAFGALMQELTPENVPNLTIAHYDVAGRTARQVREALKHARPVHEGQPVDAATRWSYDTVWSNDESGACLPQTARIDYSITLTLPRLSEAQYLTPVERDRWDAYVASVAGHEMQRARLVAEGLDQVALQLRAAAACHDMLSMRTRLIEEMDERVRIHDETAAEWRRRNRHLVPFF